MIDLIGYAASVLIAVSLIPQFVKSWKTKSTHDISLWQYIFNVSGGALFLLYGILLPNGPIIALNSFSLVLAAGILYLKIKYG